jgi:hypothetical protein
MHLDPDRDNSFIFGLIVSHPTMNDHYLSLPLSVFFLFFFFSFSLSIYLSIYQSINLYLFLVIIL